MPRIKSAKKRLRQSRARTDRNKTQRSQLRTAVKKARTAGAPDAAEVKAAEKLLDRAGRKRLIHPNTAARQKSRLAKALKAKAS